MTAVSARASPTAATIRELLELDLITVDDAVAQGIVVTDASVSHCSVKVRIDDVARLFVKRSDPVRSAGRDLTTEAAVYRLAQSSPQLADVVPRCAFVSADDSLIVLEAAAGTPLSETELAFGGDADANRDLSSRSVLCKYGNAVARAHGVHPGPLGQPPWLLDVFEPGWGSYPWLPDPCRELLVRLGRTPRVSQGFRRAASRWRAECLVHGDLRWSNVLVALDAAPPRVWLVDWELACLGDPAWDIASVLADLLAAAALGSLHGRAPDIWPAAQSFLGGYRASAPLTPDAWWSLMQRSVALSGVRLVQTLVEFGHHDEATLRAMTPILLPWATHLLDAPPAVVAELARDGARECSCPG